MKAVVGIATTGKRKKQLRLAANSLIDQVEAIHVWDNSTSKNLTDNGKFAFVDIFNTPVYYFSCDDDIIYPKDYISKTIEWIEEKGCIISWHGRILNPMFKKYYKADHKGFRYFEEVNECYTLDVAGTGVTGFRTDYFNPDIWQSEYKCMSDLVFSLEARKQGKVIITPPKGRGWIKGQEVDCSIYKTYADSDQSQQIHLMNEIIKCTNS